MQRSHTLGNQFIVEPPAEEEISAGCFSSDSSFGSRTLLLELSDQYEIRRGLDMFGMWSQSECREKIRRKGTPSSLKIVLSLRAKGSCAQEAYFPRLKIFLNRVW